MLKAISTVVAATVVVGVLGLCGVGPGSAQDARTEEMKAIRAREEAKGKVIEAEARRINRVEVVPLEVEADAWRLETSPVQTYVLAGDRNAPGTWSIIDTKAGVMLLNTATGASYLMKDAEVKPRWVKVENPPDATPTLEFKWESRGFPMPSKIDTRLAELREIIAKLSEEAKNVRDRWSKADDREARGKLSDELEALEDKVAKLKEEAKKLEEELRARKDEKQPRER
ncbi:MAG: hypothetical protein IT462_13270 [Planctomycetes bacterium]|nr:hypothetical protein [Planctomycetota bacterium]